MYIKTLTIQGFKSYRDQTAIEPFSPKHNVVVGRNGSGKSNFFAAIRFVLSDAYTSMSREERQSLLHEGPSTSTTFSAYVEIVFDNSDNRFPTGKDEVILRRTIGQKKDEYSLDKKSASKADVMNLLESAGFSKSNPYYIVPQGRITSLTNMKDHERLAMLKEVAGTKVYENRRAESLRIMSETDAKRAKIKELLTYIEERLEELEEEKEELKEFQEQDKERRCLEYALYSRELIEVGQQLEDLEDSRKRDGVLSRTMREESDTREKEIAALNEELASLKESLSISDDTKADLDNEMQDLLRTRTELECIIADLEQTNESGEDRRVALEEELQTVQERINEIETELMEVIPEWEDKIKEEKQKKQSLDETQAQLDALHSKQGRITQFRTRAERDAYLRSEIASITEFERTQASTATALTRELEGTKGRIAQLERKTEEADAKMEERQQMIVELNNNLVQWKEEQIQLTEERKELWREDAKLSSQKQHANDQLKSAERQLSSTMDKDTSSALNAVDRLANQLGLDGVYGPLYRLFEIVDPSYNTAVENVAGNSLWNVVVDTDATAAKLLEQMNREKTGRITFMPLNRLRVRQIQFPQTNDAEPLIKKIRYDPAHARAFEDVFGRTLVCKELSVAANYSRAHGLNTITIDGDRVDRKGTLTGGYHDVKRSRLDAIRNVKKWRPALEDLQKKHAEVVGRITRLDQQITGLTGKIQVAESKLRQLHDGREPLVQELRYLRGERERLGQRVLKFESDLADLETERLSNRTKRESYGAELGTPMVNGLSDEEAGRRDELSREVDLLKRELVNTSERKNEAAERKDTLEAELNESLRRRQDEIYSKLESIGNSANAATPTAGDIEARRRELDRLNGVIATLEEKMSELEAEQLTLKESITAANNRSEELQAEQQEDARAIRKQKQNMERYQAKKALLTSKHDECEKNIRDLGVLPEEAFTRYTKMKLERIVKRLKAVNDALKKFAHVNKKAFEQYNNFTKQRDQLIKRREDLDKSATSIEELVAVLDQRKDEAIERTFKQVSKYFEEVFERLVPAGRGRLLMQKSIDQEPGPEEDDEEREPRSTIDNYTGVSIKVSFNSKVDEGLRIQQLSGGQKSLVALATVFAIQKCDPAPFYLFDEIDANLDAQYRTSVASMIHELSATAQFITTTFRPEMLVTSDKHYGVIFNNQKVSTIRSITRDQAREFIEQEAAVAQ